jgi:glycosyltransferase involved in cell wall biosynthesis
LIYFCSYKSKYPWSGDWFFDALEKYSEHDWKKITQTESWLKRNSTLLFWNYQTISRDKIIFNLMLNRYKKKKNLIIGGVRGNRTINKYAYSLNKFDAILLNHDIDPVLSHYVESEKLHYAPDGINSDLFQPMKKPEDLTLVWMGRKKKKFKNVEIIPELGYRYKIQSPEKYIPNHLMPRFYNSGNVYVCTSESEGFGRGLVESAFCELAIISTNVGVASRIIDSSFLINGDPKEKIREIKEMLKPFRDQKYRERVGKENREIAMCFDIRSIIPLWDKALEEII